MNIKKNKKNKKEFLNLINKISKKEKLKREEKNEEDLDKIYESVKIEEENNRQLTIMKSNLKLNKLKEINKANKKNKNMNNQNEEKNRIKDIIEDTETLKVKMKIMIMEIILITKRIQNIEKRNENISSN